MSNFPSFFTYTNPTYRGPGKKANILVHKNGKTWLCLNDPAFEMAKALGKGQSLQEVSLNLQSKFQIPLETAMKDASKVLDQLEKGGFKPDAPKEDPKRTPSFKELYFHLTDRCNLSCLHCYVDAKKSGNGLYLPKEHVKRLTHSLSKAGGKNVTFSGGEPLLHPDIREIIESAASRAKVQLLTNGLLINDSLAAFLGGNRVSVQISLDGSESRVHDIIRGPGSFKRAVNAIKTLQKAGLDEGISISSTIMKHNIKDIKNLSHFAQSLGVNKLRFLPLRMEGRAKPGWDSLCGLDLKGYESFFDHVSRLNRNREATPDITCGLTGLLFSLGSDAEKDDAWCPVGKRLVVSENGDVFPCVLMMKEEFKLGNALVDEPEKIMASGKMAGLCKTLVKRRETITKCRGCDYKDFCQSGCMGQALDHKPKRRPQGGD